MGANKKSVAASVLRQSREAKKVASHNFREKYTRSKASEQGLVLAFPVANRQPHVVDLSFLADLPNLRKPFVEGFRRWGATVGEFSRRNAVSSLSNYFVPFVREAGLESIRLIEIDSSLLWAFIKWLDRRGLEIGTRDHALGYVKSMMRGLQQIRPWTDDAKAVLRAMPRRPWPGASTKVTPRERLSLVHIRAIIEAAENEVRRLMAHWETGVRLIQEGRTKIAKGRKDYNDLATCLAVVEKRFPVVIPVCEEIYALDRELEHAVRRIHGKRNLGSYLYPSARDLVPFAILIAVATAFNPQTILKLSRNDIAFEIVFGRRVSTVRGAKPRGRTDPRVTISADDVNGIGFGSLIEQLDFITSRLRRANLNPIDAARLFLFSPMRRDSGSPVSTFYSSKCRSGSDVTWTHNLRVFISDNKLAPFSLSQIRATLLDEIQVQTGDLLTAQGLGVHASRATTWRHYTSDGTKKRYQERLGEIGLLRERWVKSNGKIDPRIHARGSSMDAVAATPGFVCLDPLNSPQPGEVLGRLCSAYGACPSCPLAAADVNDPPSVAAYLALEKAIYAAQPIVGPNAWRARWAPILNDLRSLLSHAPEAVLKQAKLFDVELPVVG